MNEKLKKNRVLVEITRIDITKNDTENSKTTRGLIFKQGTDEEKVVEMVRKTFKWASE